MRALARHDRRSGRRRRTVRGGLLEARRRRAHCGRDRLPAGSRRPELSRAAHRAHAAVGASFNGLVDAVVLLLESRANVDEPATSGTTPLMEAARGGHVDAIRMLLRTAPTRAAPPLRRVGARGGARGVRRSRDVHRRSARRSARRPARRRHALRPRVRSRRARRRGAAADADEERLAACLAAASAAAPAMPSVWVGRRSSSARACAAVAWRESLQRARREARGAQRARTARVRVAPPAPVGGRARSRATSSASERPPRNSSA